MPQKIAAYIIIAVFFGMDSFFRDTKPAKSIAKTPGDNKSTLFIVAAFFTTLALSVVANLTGFGAFANATAAWAGVGLMLAGICIRVTAMLTLSKYYTRTLLTVDAQHVVQKGLYKIIRHPGYLGTILIWCAAGLAMANTVVITGAMVAILAAYLYRIYHEEKMLTAMFGQEYTNYTKKSWRVLPFVW